MSICRNPNVILDIVFLYFAFCYHDLHFTIIFKNSFFQPFHNIIIPKILSFHSKMLRIYMYMISLCSRLISIYLILLLMLVHIVSLYFACCHCKRHHVIILWHSIILLYIEIITWGFRYNPIYQPETPISDRGLARGPILIEG